MPNHLVRSLPVTAFDLFGQTKQRRRPEAFLRSSASRLRLERLESRLLLHGNFLGGSPSGTRGAAHAHTTKISMARHSRALAGPAFRPRSVGSTVPIGQSLRDGNPNRRHGARRGQADLDRCRRAHDEEVERHNAKLATVASVYRGPRLRLFDIEIEGPLVDAWPPASHTALVGATTNAQEVDITGAMTRLAERAFRRPACGGSAGTTGPGSPPRTSGR